MSAARNAAPVTRRRNLWLSVVVVILGLAGWLYFPRTHALTDKDTIVLADFENKMGDAVFDGTLRQGLSVQLEQSPFLSMISDSKINETLKLMGRPVGDRLTPEVTREVCQRTGCKAYIAGSIGSLGSEYVLGLKAVNCQNGDTLAQAQVTAASREKVLDALDGAASKLRSELGESLSMVKKFDTPLAQATTSSLDALKAYSLAGEEPNWTGAVELYKRAIELDPNFALAYLALGTAYSNHAEAGAAAENMRKAFELREHATEREKLIIESHYYEHATGDLIRAKETYELRAQVYPQDGGPLANLGVVYWNVGQYDNALAATRKAHDLHPTALTYNNLANCYIFLNRLDEARATLIAAPRPDPVFSYRLAFLRNDAAGMAQQVARYPDGNHWLLDLEANTAAYSGRLKKAREFFRSAVALAEQSDEKELGALYETDGGVKEALFGNTADARARAAAALRLSTGRDVEYWTALLLAFAGDTVRGEPMANDLAKRFPDDTIVQFNYLPTLRAQLTLNTGNFAKAVELLQAAASYELGWSGGLYPVYVRGEAYLRLHKGTEASVEFREIIDHGGIVGNDSIGALAHLQLGRAYLLQGDTANARAAYQDFLTLWKDADPDIPIYKQAKAEYAKLQ